MKDYNLLMYLAKLTGAKPKKDKDVLYCYFPYSDDAVITTFFTFKNKKSTAVYFDLTDIYEAHATSFGSYEDFVDEICDKYDFFEARDVEGDYYVYSDLSVNKLDNTASAALTNITVIINCLNEMLGRNEESYSEEDWRDLHRGYLAKQKRISLIAAIGSLVGAGLGAALMFLSDGTGFLALLGFFLVPVGIVAAIFFGLRNKYYASQIKKSLDDRR